VARAWLASDATHSRVVVGWVRRRVLARRSRARVGAAAGEGALAVARGAAASSSSDRWVLLKNPAQLTDTQSATLAAIRAAGGKVARAWAMKEMVRASFAKGPHRRGGQRTDRSAARPSLPLPARPLRPARPNDPQTPRGDPRRPSPEVEQRQSGGVEQQGETDRPSGIPIPLRPSRARARSPHLRHGHSDTLTRTPVRVTSPTIMPGKPN